MLLLASRRFTFASLTGLRVIHTTYMSPAKVAVVLSGCGVYDGSEIHEASAGRLTCLFILLQGCCNTLGYLYGVKYKLSSDRFVTRSSNVTASITGAWYHLSRHNAQVSMFAPDINQMHVIDHLKGAPVAGETRNVLVESARIARGKIQPLNELNVNKFDAIVFPGGFGAAKNLSSFAVDGAKMQVNTEVEGTIKAFHAAKKPIGLCCISPVLAASVITGCEVTIGSDPNTAADIEKMGAKHVERKHLKVATEHCKAVPIYVQLAVSDEAHVDATNKVITTPAFMCDAPLHEIFDGIGVMITNTLKLAEAN